MYLEYGFGIIVALYTNNPNYFLPAKAICAYGLYLAYRFSKSGTELEASILEETKEYIKEDFYKTCTLFSKTLENVN